jgi:haloacetate dehalogenase
VTLFPGFETATLDTGEASIRVRIGGSGPPLLLLHGHPQTHVMWHLIAPRLAEDFTIVAADLRGYGDSSKPASTPDHEPYSKRAFARDQVKAMEQLGFERFSVAGHDRGGRTGYRMALDSPDRVLKLAVLDIIPTVEVWDAMDARLAMANWHWLFLAQPEPLAETLIGRDVDAYYFRSGRERFHPEALAEYVRALCDPATIHAICEDYRAAATYDREADRRDREAGRRIACPLLVLWSTRDDLPPLDPLGIWGRWADDVRGAGLDCGHYLAEELPDETYEHLRGFFSA